MKILERSEEERNILLSLILILVNIVYALILYSLIYPNINTDNFHQTTYYLIRFDFLIAFIPLNAISFIFFFKLGKLNFSKLGLNKKGFFRAFIFILIIWWSTQLFYCYTNLIMRENPMTKSYWTNILALPYFLGEFIVEFLGNSLFEEVLYRAVLFSQLLIYFKKKKKFSDEENRLIIAIIISQLLFAIAHIPNRFISGYYTLDEAIIGIISPFAFGVFIAYVYYLTNNLYICIGLHGLGNIEISIFSTIFPPTQWFLYVIFFFVFFSTIYKQNTIKKDIKDIMNNKKEIINIS
ncbi:MAG: CPBP family intramembrane metalloprotease [Candidatus Lokiarchaeota archaeon]|nr:CPBP family intramembrane metalloprotease [Candidatus Lokiarchaeota archaeon]